MTSYLVNEQKFEKIKNEVEVTHRNIEKISIAQSKLHKLVIGITKNIQKSLDVTNNDFKTVSKEILLLDIEKTIEFLIADLRHFNIIFRDIIFSARKGQLSPHLIEFNNFNKKILKKVNL